MTPAPVEATHSEPPHVEPPVHGDAPPATVEPAHAEPHHAEPAPPDPPEAPPARPTLDAAGLDLLFREARSHNRFTDRPVTDDELRALHELLKMGPTSANSSPARFLFLRTQEAKQKLAPALSAGNLEKTLAAPVTVIVAYDPSFHDKLWKLFPHNPDARSWFTDNPSLAAVTAFRNGTLQGAYLILAARALGLDAGPMSGFDNAKVDELFLADRGWRSNFLCNLGHGDPEGLFPRSSRLDFYEACVLL